MGANIVNNDPKYLKDKDRMGANGKGSWVRPSSISEYEKELRWELIKESTTQERKQEILTILEELKHAD